MADRMKGKEMPVFSGFQKLALIQAFGQMCGLRPLGERRRTNIYAVVFDLRSGQEAAANIGLRLGVSNEEMKIRNNKQQHLGGFL